MFSLQMIHKLTLVLVVAVWVACVAVPLDPTQDFSFRDSIPEESIKLFRRRSQTLRTGLVFDAIHDCRTNSTLKNMCNQCAHVATNGAETFTKCCANRQKVRDWCVDFINYIID